MAESNELVRRAIDGDRQALEQLVTSIQDTVYNLALRMLWHPEDAQDATQEILVRIVTKLSTFRGDSAFETWAYRVATNHLLTTRKRRSERQEITFEDFGDDLMTGLADIDRSSEPDPEEALLAREVKVGCSHAMLQCLDRDLRIAYILGEILELSSEEAAAVLDITRAAYRKRLSRARSKIEPFVRAYCGVVDETNPCSCRGRIDRAVDLGRIDTDRLLFVERSDDADRNLERVESIHEAGTLFRSNPRYAAPADFTHAIRHLIESSYP